MAMTSAEHGSVRGECAPRLTTPVRLATCLVVAGAAVLSTGLPLDARLGSPHQVREERQAPTFRGGINYVRLDVNVTDRSGKPVDDLRPEDFEITEGGTRQQIDTFKLLSLASDVMASGPEPRPIRSDAEAEREAARDDVRLLAIFLDDYHVKRASAMQVREQLARFVETQLGSGDIVGIMRPLDPISGLRLTRNHAALGREILQFEGRKYDYLPMNDQEKRYVGAHALDIERIRTLVSLTAIRSLIMRLGALKEGRKLLFVISEGYIDAIPPQLVTYYGGLPNRLRAVPGLPPLPPREPPVDMNAELRSLSDLANRSNVSIYAVDPRGLAISEFGVDLPVVEPNTDRRYLTTTMDTLRALAEDSSGRAIVNRNDVATDLRRILIDSSAYYLIGYASTTAAADGRFHEIRVRVKRSNVEVRHRPGYWAPKPDDVPRLTSAPVAPSAVGRALAELAMPRDRSIRTWVGHARGESGLTEVTVAWEPAPARPGDPATDRPAFVEITAAGADGSLYFRGQTPDGPNPTANAAGGSVSFGARPGLMRLRLSVRSASGETIDSEVRDVDVRDLASSRTLLGTPVVFRARTRPELQRLKTDTHATPTASRDFVRTDVLLLRVPVYAWEGRSLQSLTADLVNGSGHTMAEIAITPPESGHSSAEIEFSLASLGTGGYGIVLRAATEEGEVSELVVFRVLP